MKLTIKQEIGLRTAVDRYKAGEKYTVISGYAGSGKSTLVRFIVAALGVPEDKIAYVAYTGKAAKVLAQKGCANATTAHKLLYYAKPMPNGHYKFSPKSNIEYNVVIVDEVSMLPRSMWELLLRHPAYIIACGDPGQLPPVDKTEANDVLAKPHVFLDEIMRQAQESEIIRLSMHVREGLPLSTFECAGEQVRVIQKRELVDGMYSWADQILCATNRTRIDINNAVRAMRGYGPEPCPEDRVISLRNHWDLLSSAQAPLTNGTIGTLSNFIHADMLFPHRLFIPPVDCLLSEVTTDDGDNFSGLYIDYKALITGEKTLTPQLEYKVIKAKDGPEPPLEFAYAYAITTWKAQGSEWDRVLGFEESFPFDKEEHKKYLYTMITRAKEKLVVVQK